MKSLGDLLLKYSIPGLRFSEIRRVCAEETSAVMNCPLQAKDIQYKDEEIRFAVSPVLKSAIILKQDLLRERLAARGITVKTFR